MTAHSKAYTAIFEKSATTITTSTITGWLLSTAYYISRGEMYSGHGRLYVCLCLSVPCRIPTLLHGPGCKSEEWQGVPHSYALLGRFAIGAQVSLL